MDHNRMIRFVRDYLSENELAHDKSKQYFSLIEKWKEVNKVDR